MVCGVLAVGIGACGSCAGAQATPPGPRPGAAAAGGARGPRRSNGRGISGRRRRRAARPAIRPRHGRRRPGAHGERRQQPSRLVSARAPPRSRGLPGADLQPASVCSGETAHYDCSAGANDWGKAWQDVVGAVRFVESRGARHVAVGGSSIGGTTVVYAAATGRIHPVALISLAGVNHIDAYSLTRAGVRRIGGAKLLRVRTARRRWRGGIGARVQPLGPTPDADGPSGHRLPRHRHVRPHRRPRHRRAAHPAHRALPASVDAPRAVRPGVVPDRGRGSRARWLVVVWSLSPTSMRWPPRS